VSDTAGDSGEPDRLVGRVAGQRVHGALPVAQLPHGARVPRHGPPQARLPLVEQVLLRRWSPTRG
jgi:hypothetical protein